MHGTTGDRRTRRPAPGDRPRLQRRLHHPRRGRGLAPAARPRRRRRRGAPVDLRGAPLLRALVVGRTPDEVIDIVSRICGICPVAYQMSAVHGFEHLFGIEIDPQVRALRRLLYCGEWIQSPRPPHLPAPRPGLPGLSVGDRDGRRPQGDRRPRPGHQEGRQPDPEHARRSGDPSDQRARRRLLEGAEARAHSTTCGARSTTPSRRPRRPSGWWPASTCPTTTASPSSSSLVHPTEYPYNHGPDQVVRRRRPPGRPLGRRVRGDPRRGHERPPGPDPRRRRLPARPGRADHPDPADAPPAGRGGPGQDRPGRRDPDQHLLVDRRPRDRAAARLCRGARPDRRLPAPGRAPRGLDGATRAGPPGRPRRRAGCSSTATRSTSAGSCRPPRSCRRPARTRPRSRPTWPPSPRASSTCHTRKPRSASSN